ncbi:MAG TPA: hypothetical protein DEP80_01315 [Anaerolineae bacterium]|nr:hypothetical protein [Anaerolineae bacterium]HCM96734.1 hypothetical protein [Anaerolineae bacterium]
MNIIDESQSNATQSPIPEHHKINIGIVGPCSAGKTTLINGLREHGYSARHIAQEHSYVPDMWQRLSHPDILIFLDVSFPVSQQRRLLDWNIDDFEEQQKRLGHARQNADLVINTDDLFIEEILTRVISFLQKINP